MYRGDHYRGLMYSSVCNNSISVDNAPANLIDPPLLLCTLSHSTDLPMTLHTLYTGSQYFIPVSIIVMLDHPRSAPHVYIKPTASMELVLSEMVNSFGRVYIEFLRNWNRVSISNMMHTCEEGITLSLTTD